jgi:hypothetical protein
MQMPMSPEKAALVQAINALQSAVPEVLTERRGGVSNVARRLVTQDITNLERVAISVADKFEQATAALSAKDGTIQSLRAELAQKDAAMSAALLQKDAVIEARDAALAEKNSIIAGKEREIAEGKVSWASFAYRYRWPAGAALATAAGLWWYASRK